MLSRIAEVQQSPLTILNIFSRPVPNLVGQRPITIPCSKTEVKEGSRPFRLPLRHQHARGSPRSLSPEPSAFDQHHTLDVRSRQRVGGRDADNSATDDNDIRTFSHSYRESSRCAIRCA